MSGIGLDLVESESTIRTVCHVCGRRGASPPMLLAEYDEIARLVSPEILTEHICESCWIWTKRVARASRMRQILKGSI